MKGVDRVWVRFDRVKRVGRVEYFGWWAVMHFGPGIGLVILLDPVLLCKDFSSDNFVKIYKDQCCIF